MDEKKRQQAADEPVEFFINQPDPSDVPMAQPVGSSETPLIELKPRPKGDEFQCPECRKIFIVALTKRPLHIRCPYCGLEGMID